MEPELAVAWSVSVGACTVDAGAVGVWTADAGGIGDGLAAGTVGVALLPGPGSDDEAVTGIGEGPVYAAVELSGV